MNRECLVRDWIRCWRMKLKTLVPLVENWSVPAANADLLNGRSFEESGHGSMPTVSRKEISDFELGGDPDHRRDPFMVQLGTHDVRLTYCLQDDLPVSCAHNTA